MALGDLCVNRVRNHDELDEENDPRPVKFGDPEWASGKHLSTGSA